MVLVFVLISLLSLTLLILSYHNHVDTAIEREFAGLRATTRSLSLNIDAEEHMALAQKYSQKDALRSNEQDASYQRLSTLLLDTYKAMGLDSDIYTLVKDEHSGDFQFLVSSASRPYFRHTWTHPHEEHVRYYDYGSVLGPYETENGTWLSSFTPIKYQGQTVAIVQADKHFEDFIQEARSEFMSTMLVFLLVVGLGTLALIQMINRILGREEERSLMLLSQADQLELKNKDIMDSIAVAKRLQEASLPDLKSIQVDIPEIAVMYQPKDIVSGDFYWHEKVGSKVYLAAGDCTGHGVPGAFMSMLAVSSLYHVLNKNRNCLGQFLTELDANIRKHLHSECEVTEGMDMAICSFDLETGEFQYAGALRPLVLIRDRKVIKHRGDRAGIGAAGDGFQYEAHRVPVVPGDVIYLFSDGFTDQFGGEEGRKYMSKRFTDFLVQIQDHTLEEQKYLLQYEFHHWREEEEQVDDVLVMGFRIPSLVKGMRLSA